MSPVLELLYCLHADVSYLGRKAKEQSGSATDEQPRTSDQNSTALDLHQVTQSASSEPCETRDQQVPDPGSPTLKAQWSSMIEDGNEGATTQMTVLDPMMFHMPHGSSTTNPYNFPLAGFCGCNGATGPCARHLDEIRSQIFQSTQQFPRQSSRATGGFNSPVHSMHDTVMEENFGNVEPVRQTPATNRPHQGMSLPLSRYVVVCEFRSLFL
jgi:hypothetical protein